MLSIYDLKPRFQALLRPLVSFLAQTGVTAKYVTLAAMVLSVLVGETLSWSGDRRSYMRQLDERMKQLATEGNFPSWSKVTTMHGVVE